MTAPTEAEIRIVVAQTGNIDPAIAHKLLADIIYDWSAPINSAAWEALEADLRVSEAVVLSGAVEAARERALSRCIEVIIDELTTAGVRFAEAFPDAPRARQEAIA